MTNYWEKQGGGGGIAHAPYAKTNYNSIEHTIPSDDPITELIKKALKGSAMPGRTGMEPIRLGHGAQTEEFRNAMRLLPGIPEMPSANVQGLDPSKGTLADRLSGLFGGVVDRINKAVGDSGEVKQDFPGMWNGGNSAYQDSQGLDPQSVLDQLRKQYGEYKYGGDSAQTMTNREFDPQFSALNAEKAATDSRYQQNSKQMGGLYNALKQDAVQGRSQNSAAYKQSGQEIGQIYGDASKNVTNNANASTAEIGKQLALLNQGQAAPAVFNDSQKALNQQLGSLASAQGTAAAMNTQLGANTYAADTDRQGIVGQAGANAQADLSGQREQLMQQYASQNLGLQAQKGKTLNQYGQSIEQLIQQGNAGINDAVNKAFDTIMRTSDNQQDRELKIQQLNQASNEARAKLQMQAQNDSFNNDLRTQQLDLDKEKFGFDSLQRMNKADGAGAADTSKMNPYDALLANSNKYNTDPQEGANDAEVVYQTAIKQSGAQSMQQLMDALEENSPGWLARPGNKSIAYDYFNRLLSQNKR